jgi:hypothetical protein
MINGIIACSLSFCRRLHLPTRGISSLNNGIWHSSNTKNFCAAHASSKGYTQEKGVSHGVVHSRLGLGEPQVSDGHLQNCTSDETHHCLSL